MVMRKKFDNTKWFLLMQNDFINAKWYHKLNLHLIDMYKSMILLNKINKLYIFQICINETISNRNCKSKKCKKKFQNNFYVYYKKFVFLFSNFKVFYQYKYFSL